MLRPALILGLVPLAALGLATADDGFCQTIWFTHDAAPVGEEQYPWEAMWGDRWDGYYNRTGETVRAEDGLQYPIYLLEGADGDRKVEKSVHDHDKWTVSLREPGGGWVVHVQVWGGRDIAKAAHMLSYWRPSGNGGGGGGAWSEFGDVHLSCLEDWL